VYEGEQSTPLLQLPACAEQGAVWHCDAGGRLESAFWLAKPFENFFNACTYHSELIVAPLSKNFTNKIPSLFQKTLAPPLHTEVCS
jgi:hypothetical protein